MSSYGGYGAAQPLSKKNWRQRQDRGSWSYGQYINFWNQRHHQQNQTPGTMSFQQLMNLANRFFPQGQTDEQQRQAAKTSVQASIDPIIKQITDSINQRSASGSAAINAATSTYANRMSQIAPEVQQQYGQAKTEQAAVDQALVGLAQGQGQAAYQEMAGGLGQAGASPEAVAASAGTLQGLAGGAAQQLGGTGASTMSRLISQGAGDTSYAQSLPGFAQGQGQLGLSQFQGMLNQMLNDKTGELNAQVPGMVESTYQNMVSRGDADAAARASFINQGLDRNLSAWTARAGLGMDQQQLTEQGRQFNASQKQANKQFQLTYGMSQKQFKESKTEFWASLAQDGIKSSNKKGWTKQELSQARAQAYQFAIDNVLTDKIYGGLKKIPADTKQGKLNHASPYDYWRIRVVNYLSGLLSGTPLTRADFQKMADQALASMGVHPKPKQTQQPKSGR